MQIALSLHAAKEDAVEQAIDCLQEALATRIADGLDVPAPSAARKGERMITPPALISVKAELYVAMRETGTTNVALAKRLKCDENFSGGLSVIHPSAGS